MNIQVSILQLASVKRIIADAEAAIFAETSTNVRLTVIEQLNINLIDAVAIRDYVCTLLGIEVRKIVTSSRLRHLVDARKIIAVLVRDYTASAWREIADALGGKDHSSAIHYYNTAQDLIKTDDGIFCAKYHMVHRAFQQHLDLIKNTNNATTKN